jgi:beta-lactamase class A
VPLTASFSEESLRSYLKDQVAALYDEPPLPSAPIEGTLDFTPSQPGTALDIDQAVPQIAAALRSRTTRQVQLSYTAVPAPRPPLSSLQLLLEQTVQRMGYNGTLELYLSNPQSGDKLQLAYDQGKPAPADIAFTAASTMKIPIMISVFRRQPDPLPANIQAMFAAMIEFSDNDMSDKLLETLEKNLGPILLTEDIQALGLQNTFLGGYYYPGAPLLQRFETPANQRSDINTAPDVYNQTTPADMGVLLEDIYTCAEQNQSPMQTAFPGQLTQSKCRQMVEFMSKNRNGVLLEAGLPEGTRVAHKHGWTTDSDGLIHAISDAGIVYSPGGSYVLTIYIYDREQLIWERMNFMIALLSQAAYNFYNLP